MPYYSDAWTRRIKRKRFKADRRADLLEKCREIFDAKLEVMVQSIMLGSNTNHA